FIDASIDAFLSVIDRPGIDGRIMTMRANDPKWSFVRPDSNGHVEEVAEKQVISNQATVGIYLFCRGQEFVKAAEDMIAADERVNGEFYVAPVYNRLIKDKKIIDCFDIGTVGAGMYGLGTPEDLTAFLSNP